MKSKIYSNTENIIVSKNNENSERQDYISLVNPHHQVSKSLGFEHEYIQWAKVKGGPRGS